MLIAQIVLQAFILILRISKRDHVVEHMLPLTAILQPP
jgi:hypothetical protein